MKFYTIFISLFGRTLMAGALLTVLIGSSFPLPHVSAEPSDQGNIDNLISYCKKQAPKAKSACNKDSMEHANNVATYHCKNQTDNDSNDKNKCIVSKAKGYINDAADGAGSAAEFTKQLNQKLKDVGGDPKKPEKDSANSDENVTTTECNTNGLCADCNGRNGDGCLDCSSGKCVDAAADPDASCGRNSCDLIKKYVNPTINLLTAFVSLMAVASIIYGGIQYAASDGDPQKVSRAKGRIFNTVYALVAYMFLFAFLQFLVPGGIFNRS